MPTQLQHHRHAGRGPCSTRLLTLGLTLTAALSLSACGPAHKGQLSVEPAGASAEASPSGSGAPSKTPTPTPSAAPSSTTWTAPNVTISNDTSGTWRRKDDILKQPIETSSEISQAYNFDAGGCLAIIFYKANQTIYDERGRGGDNTISSVKIPAAQRAMLQDIVSSGRSVTGASPLKSSSSAIRTSSPPPIRGISSCPRHEWRDSMPGPWDR